MEETIKNILKRLDNLEFRVSSLEKEKNKVVMRRPVKKKVSGVVGGIYELIDAGFFERTQTAE